MKTGITEVVFLLDRSGSMGGLELDTIGGFNSMLHKQRLIEGKVKISTVLFDHQFEVIHHRLPLEEVADLTLKEYFVRGSTALLDAIGRSIKKIGSIQKYATDENRSEKVLFVIITDGMENASTEFSSRQIKQMIKNQTADYNWEFLFIGANIDAVETARSYGIKENRAANYHHDSRGTMKNFDAVNAAIVHLRDEGSIKDDWKVEIDKDFNTRKQ